MRMVTLGTGAGGVGGETELSIEARPHLAALLHSPGGLGPLLRWAD